QKFLDMNNVIEGVALESANMYSALDFSNMNTSEISDTRKMLDAFSIARSNAFENNDIVAFNSATKGMSQYLRDELGLTREEVRELVSHFSTFEEKMNNVSNSSELTAEAMSQLMMETDLTEQQIAELSGSFEELDNSLKESTDSIKNINGVLESYHENGSLTTEKMLELIDIYPELINHINDEGKFIEALTDIRDNDVKNAENAMIEKLMLSSSFYQSNLDLIKEFVEGQFDYYKGDLSNFQNLAQAKADIETQLINELSKKWSAYYDEVAKRFVNPEFFSTTEWKEQNHSFAMPFGASDLGELDKLLQANNELKTKTDEASKASKNFSIGQINLDFKTLGTSLSNKGKKIGKVGEKARKAGEKGTKANKDGTKSQKEITKAVEDSIYVVDNYKQAMELLDLAFARVNAQKSKYAKWSAQYRKELKKEIDLLKEKEKAIKAEMKSVQQQIKTGNIQKTGIVSAPSGGSS